MELARHVGIRKLNIPGGRGEKTRCGGAQLGSLGVKVGIELVTYAERDQYLF